MKINKKGFTLIELLISITIFMILVVMSFVPYQYYGNIAKVKLAAKDISQSISEARNLAINGYDKNGKNQSIAVLFDKANNEINYYSYDFSSGILNVNFNSSNILKKKALPENIFINDIAGRDKVALYFSSIFGSGVVMDGNGTVINTDIIDINISFKTSIDPNLNKKITFYKKTNLTDY